MNLFRLFPSANGRKAKNQKFETRSDSLPVMLTGFFRLTNFAPRSTKYKTTESAPDSKEKGDKHNNERNMTDSLESYIISAIFSDKKKQDTKTVTEQEVQTDDPIINETKKIIEAMPPFTKSVLMQFEDALSKIQMSVLANYSLQFVNQEISATEFRDVFYALSLPYTRILIDEELLEVLATKDQLLFKDVSEFLNSNPVERYLKMISEHRLRVFMVRYMEFQRRKKSQSPDTKKTHRAQAKEMLAIPSKPSWNS